MVIVFLQVGRIHTYQILWIITVVTLTFYLQCEELQCFFNLICDLPSLTLMEKAQVKSEYRYKMPRPTFLSMSNAL